jgi:photosystem II stability/assembly factor-like uncharacterized protein
MKAFLATRKGLLVLKPTASGWEIERAHYDGVKVTYVAKDPHRPWVWAGLNHGHWGPKLSVSKDKGKTFADVSVPKFPEGSGTSVAGYWAITRDKQGRLYCGTAPAAIFYSDNDGQDWKLNEPLFNQEGKDKWFSGGAEGGSCLHSILVDPRDDDHLIAAISVGGVLQTYDRGKTWSYQNSGLKAYFMPDHNDPISQDPHLVEMAPSNPEVLWQQNHCGIFKSDNSGKAWQDLSKSKGLQSAFGWAVVIDEEDAEVAYTIPALSDETRVPVKKKLVVQKTTNGGKSWTVLNKGLPDKNCYDIVYRHAFAKSGKQMLFASTTGHVYFSKNSGQSWKQMKHQLAPVYAVKFLD